MITREQIQSLSIQAIRKIFKRKYPQYSSLYLYSLRKDQLINNLIALEQAFYGDNKNIH